jgi:P pilus assembly protein, chaperone PapD
MLIRRIAAIKIMLFFLILCFFQSSHAGFSMMPLIVTLEPSKQITTGEVVISFQGDVKAPTAIEIKVKGREVLLDGATVLYHEDKSADNFVVYPSQIVLMPGEIQRVQIKWVGESIPKKEIAYGLIAEEAPIKLGDENEARTKPMGRLIITGRYEGAIVVLPSGVKPSTLVDSAKSGLDTAGNNQLILLINNKGSARQKLQGIKLQVTPLDKNGKMIFNKSMAYKPIISDAQTKQSLFPGYLRRLTMPWPPGLAVGPIKVTVEFETEK